MSYYYVAEHKRHKAEKVFRREANKLVSSLLHKVFKSGKGFDNVIMKVGAENVYSYSAYKGTEHNFSPEIVDKINTAFTTPQDLKGSVSVQVNNEPVFLADNGELLFDLISLVDSRYCAPQKLEDKLLTWDIERIMNKITLIDLEATGDQSVAIAKDLTLYYKDIDSGYEIRQEFDYINHNDKMIFYPSRFTKDATESEINYLKNYIHQIKDISFNREEKDLKDTFEKVLSQVGKTDKEDVVTYDSPKLHISKGSEQWLSIISKESGKEIFNNLGFTQDVTEDDKKEIQKIEFFIHEKENSEFLVVEDEREEIREEVLGIDI